MGDVYFARLLALLLGLLVVKGILTDNDVAELTSMARKDDDIKQALERVLGGE